MKKDVDSSLDVLLNKVKIEEEFKDVESTAKNVWEILNKTGKVKTIKGRLSESPKVSAREGKTYPISASITTEINQTEYKINFEESYDHQKLKVVIEFDYKNLSVVQDILSQVRNQQAKSETISISKEYKDKEALVNLYDYILKNSTETEILPTGYRSLPQMELTSEGKFMPREAKIKAKINGEDYEFEFEHSFIEEKVSISCERSKIEFANKLLTEIQTSSEVEEEDTAKKVKSLDFIVSVSKYSWDDVGGLEEIKKELEQYIKWPLENPELLNAVNASTPSGVLLIGPPGNAKTTIAKIIANESGAVFYYISPKDINSMWVGGTEKNWGRVFSQARKDFKEGKKVIIFIDEIDGFFTSRDEMDKYSRISFGQFCQEWQGISDLQGVLILGATNRHQDLDEALVRPGRFTKKIYVGNPDENAREQIFNIYLRKMPLAKEVSAKYLAKETEGYSGSHIKDVCEGAAFSAVERYSKEKGIEIKDIRGELVKEVNVNLEDFLNAMKAQNKYKEQKKENKIGFG